MKKLYRSRENSIIAGVCGGLGAYLNIDPTIIRLVVVLLAFYNLLGLWVYIVLAVLIPRAPEGYVEDTQYASPGENKQTVRVIGGGLVILGILAIVSSLDIALFSWVRIDNFWPVLIILFGVMLLVRGFATEE